VDQIVNELIAIKAMNFGYSASFRLIDKGLIEQLGPTGLSSSIFNLSFNLVAIQSGFIYHTIFIFVYGFGLYFLLYSLLLIGNLLTVFNFQFFLILFGFMIITLTKTV